LTQPISTLDRRIESDGQQELVPIPAGHGPLGLGREYERRLVTAAQRAGGLWAASLRQKSVFSLLFFPQFTVLLFFAQILGKFHIVFSIQIIPTKNLFREFKSYRNFSIKFKVYEFYSCFRCK
jgi:hypothetical protein